MDFFSFFSLIPFLIGLTGVVLDVRGFGIFFIYIPSSTSVRGDVFARDNDCFAR